MFLVRTVFWLSLVILLLPTDAEQQKRLYAAASNAAGQAATFCDRNPALCNQGAQHWAAFKQKLEFGGRMVVSIASEHMLGGAGRQRSTAAPLPANGTLTPADLEPGWRGRHGGTGT